MSKISQKLLHLGFLKLGTNIGYDYLYRVRENQHPHAYHYHNVSMFFVCFFLIKSFVKGFSGTTAPRILKFRTNHGYDVLYSVREIQGFHVFV